MPDNPSEKLAGVCSFTPVKGCDLELIGDFSTLQDFQTLNKPLLILGSTLEGEITLYNCFLKEKQKRHGGVEVSLYYVNLVFSGVHFYSDVDVKFKSISIHYSLTNSWVNTDTTFNFRYLEGEEQLSYRGWSQIAQANIDSNYKLSVEVCCEKKYHFFENVTIDRKVFLTIESEEEKHYNDYRKVMTYVRNFLTLGITRPVFPLIMNGYVTDDLTSIVHIAGKTSDSSANVSASSMSHGDMFFTFHDISDKFDVLIKNWFSKAESLGTVYELYFGVLENPHLYYPRQEFLSLIQALESYFQTDINIELKKIERPEEEHLRMLDLIVNDAPETYKGWLRSKLRNSNSLSLSAKLMSLLKSKSFQEILKYLKRMEGSFNTFLDGQLRDKFVNGVTKTRNQLSHGSKCDIDFYGKDFRLYIERLKVLVEILLLHELGFSKEDIGILLLRSEVGLKIS